MYFTIYRDGQNQYRWNLKSDNHEPIASGESYLQKASVLHAVGLVNGNNGYRVVDKTLTLGILNPLLGVPTPLPVFGLGLHVTSPMWPATTSFADPRLGGLAGIPR